MIFYLVHSDTGLIADWSTDFEEMASRCYSLNVHDTLGSWVVDPEEMK